MGHVCYCRVDFITKDVPEFKGAIPDMDQRRERFKQTLTEFSLAKYTELEESAASDLAAFSNMARLNLKDVQFQVIETTNLKRHTCSWKAVIEMLMRRIKANCGSNGRIIIIIIKIV